MTTEDRKNFVKALSCDEADLLLHDWAFWARDEQWPPERDWHIWLVMAGRGFGKTRAGAEWIRMKAKCDQPCRIALVGETFQDVRSVMVEGVSGILSITPQYERPDWLPSRRVLIWPNGSIGTCYSASEPDQLRGPEHEFAWCDEIAKWGSDEAWKNLILGMRLGEKPQIMATTTPQAKAWLIALIKEEGLVLTRGKTIDNKAHLSPAFITAVERRFRNTRLGAQELDGVLITEHPDALWKRALIENYTEAPPKHEDLTEIIIGVDPAVGGGDETGIIIVGRAKNGLIWVLADLSLRAEPHRWASVIAHAASKWQAMKIVVEVNQGGALVEDVLRTKGVRWPIEAVRAKQGKIARAEPIAAAYAEGLVRHGDRFDQLEDQMCNAIPGEKTKPSPDRLDALVWAITAMMRQQRRSARIVEF